MNQHTISAFIGRSFDKEDELLWDTLRNFFNSLDDIGFKWEDAEKSQLKSISEKVKEKIDRNDIFIGILTKRDTISNNIFRIGKYNISETINWLTSYWVIQESGYAIGKGKKVFFLKDLELKIPDGLNADHEYIEFNRSDLKAALIKLNEIILSEIRTKIKPIETSLAVSDIEIITPSDTSFKEELRKVEDGEDEEEIKKFSDVEAAIKENNYLLAEKLFNDLLKTKFYEIPNVRKYAEARYYQDLYNSGQETGIKELKKRLEADPDDLFSREALFECYEIFNDDNSIKSEIENLIKKDISYNTKVNILVYLSKLYTRKKDFKLAIQALDLLLLNVKSNSDEHNFTIFRALGDIYKEKGDLQLSCSLFDIALKYAPTDNIRFNLAYDYGQIKNNILAMYHYKVLLKLRDDAVALNNLGYEYELLELPGKCIASYRRSMAMKYPLAMANMAKSYMEKGFYKEAKDILMDAVVIKDHHRNIDYHLNTLNIAIEDEEKKANELFDIAKGYRNFMLDYAESIAIPFDPTDIKGIWHTDHSTIKQLSIYFTSPNSIEGEHSWEYTQPTNALYGLLTPQVTRKETIKLSGTYVNGGFIYNIQVKAEPPVKSTLLGISQDREYSGIGIVSRDKQEVKFLINLKNDIQVFTANKLMN